MRKPGKLLSIKGFSFDTLLSKDKTEGPMSPVLFAQEMQKHFPEIKKISQIVRLWFDDEEVNKYDETEGGGNDTLVIVTQFQNLRQYCVFVDLGDRGVPVCIHFSNDNDAQLTPIYRKQPFMRHLDESELVNILHLIDKELYAVSI